MSSNMAKKKPPRGRPRKPTVQIQIRFVPELASAIQAHADEQRHERSQEIVLILEEKMRALNRWPPPAPTAPQGAGPA